MVLLSIFAMNMDYLFWVLRGETVKLVKTLLQTSEQSGKFRYDYVPPRSALRPNI
ncbi:hypothetical protein BH10PSE18_BH10PSE18_07250 [soil metagenome]